ncbi:N-substituted formamide deformylase [Candidatus Thermoflexus japonica]|uniref:N-substituted formamide deformylase n=1 Tax=Candidatus Thermoflexus japonica TaxID=2035417 RepID=A0A2H5Y5F2_9CHLR|nr:N-substituted formamide deformylase [Candidatus Thermoflexus japonica]
MRAADWILENARIYTQDPEQPMAEALAIVGEGIEAVGSIDEVRPWRGPRTRVLDLKGAAVLPGLIDAHLHLEGYARRRMGVDVDTPTLEEALERVARRAAYTPPGSWIIGRGWLQERWGRFPSADDLDRVAPAHPVALWARSGHALWANREAMRRAGVTRETPDPPGGRIARDLSGEPVGLFFERAIDLVARAIPEPSVEELAEALYEALHELAAMGLTAVHNFDGPRSFAALQILRERGDLPLRVVQHLPLTMLDQALALGLRTGFGDPWLRIGAVKIFADGALGPRTAWMLAPYEGEPENLGIAFTPPDAMREAARRATAAGLWLAIHAIGDRANREVLDLYAELRDLEERLGIPPEARRHRIEHTQLVHPDDIPRLGPLGIIASMQPIHAISDRPMAERYWGKRCATAYAWRSLKDHGARLAFGSDAPVEPPNPFWGLHAAVVRNGWYPEQALSLTEALEAYTVGPAWAAGLERWQGRLRPGMWADLIVLSDDPFRIPPERLRELEVLGTMVGGRWVYQRM